MKTNEEFEALTGTPKRAGKSDPNSMTNRVLSLIPTKGAVNLADLRKGKKIKDMSNKQIRTIVSNLVNKKDKNGVAKVEVKHDDDHNPYFRQFTEGG